MSIEKLNKKAKEYSLSKEIIEKRENDRLSFVKQFPLEKLINLSIDQFAQGTDKNSYCYWLEFKKIGFGIGGGNASKFGIYKTKKVNGKHVKDRQILVSTEKDIFDIVKMEYLEPENRI